MTRPSLPGGGRQRSEYEQHSEARDASVALKFLGSVDVIQAWSRDETVGWLEVKTHLGTARTACGRGSSQPGSQS